MHSPFECLICCSREECIDMLDNCSLGSFIQEALVKKMQTSGRKTTLKLKTLNGEMIHLPVDKKEVQTAEKIEEWDHLMTVSSEIIQTGDTEVGLLIGAICMKALEPLKVIACNNGGPYACETHLEWCIVGPISNTVGKDSIGCHCIAVQDAIS